MPDHLIPSDSPPHSPVKQVAQLITSRLFGAYLHCPTKCFLRASQEKATGNPYTDWLEAQNESYLCAGIKRLMAGFKQECVAVNPPNPAHIEKSTWQLAVNLLIRKQNIESSLHAVERIAPASTDKATQFIPIRFIFPNKLTRTDKLLLAFDAIALSKIIGNAVDSGRIIHGDGYVTTKVKIVELTREAKKVIGKITALLSNPDPPKLILNRYCPECEFKERCRKLAVEKDDLSLLNGLSDKERAKLNNKGIFSVTQLSYTFRPRRRSKRHAARAEKYHHALRALSIREQKTHIVGSPELKIEGTPVFLDVEALPDRDFYYLIGIRLKTIDGVVQHSLWANKITDEERIWKEFLNIMSRIAAPVLIHYGSFETAFLKRMCERYGAPPEDSAVARAIKSPINLLSIIYARIYFPAYSNGLKEIAKYLGFHWNDPASSGLYSLVWRHQWEQSRDLILQKKLTTYNADDCEALNLIADAVRQYTEIDLSSDSAQNFELGIVHTDSLKNNPAARLGTFKSSISGLEQINDAARWDYQRDRIYIRTGIKRGAIRQSQPRRATKRVEKVIVEKVSTQCPRCGKKSPKKGPLLSRTIHDLIFGKNSLKRKVIKYVFQTYRCRSCGHEYGLDKRFGHATRKYGWGVQSYFIFNIIGLCVSQNTVAHNLNRLLGFDLQKSNLSYMKARAANYYSETRNNILNRIITGNLIHADETRANIKGHRAYVWVLTNMQVVVYILAESREAELIQNLLTDFKGVLVSDFYAAYDSIECPQQKCLIHIMRDLNDEILENPFDEKLKNLVTGFAGLLQPIIRTIDRYGLKKYFLKKHLNAVERFYNDLDRAKFKSEAASKYKQRFMKNRDKLFTFMLHDGVPWNNNNAEHAIKSFALLRNIISGPSTKGGTEEYLTLLSICRTCEYQGIDFLDFLRSGEKDIPAYRKQKDPNCRKKQSASVTEAQNTTYPAMQDTVAE